MIRSFRVWRDADVGCWRWECTWCFPPARGARFGSDAHARIIRTSMPNHFEHRAGHHRWAGTNRRADGVIARRA